MLAASRNAFPAMQSTGGATIAPTAAPLLKMPVAVERSSGVNHSLVSFIAAGQFPASPTPSKNLHMPKWKGNLATACSNDAVVQKVMHKAYPNFVPSLSIIKPDIRLDAMYAAKNAVAI